MKNLAVIGGGNGGQAMAGYFAMNKDYNVRIFDYFSETIDKLNAKGYIELEGAVKGEGHFELATTNLEEAIDNADLIMIVMPALYHNKVAKDLAPYLKDGDMVVLLPSSVFGAFAFKKALEDSGNHSKISIGETNSLLFAARLKEPGTVNIGGKKDSLMIASFPSDGGEKMMEFLSPVIPELDLFDSVLATSFDSTNAMVHPLPTILNCNWSESGAKYRYYIDGIGPTCGRVIEQIDKERVDIGEKLGMKLGEDLFDFYMEYKDQYNTVGDDVSTVLKNVSAYNDIYASNEVRIRYILEDIPTGMVPFVAVGKLLNMPVKKMQLVIDICEGMLDEDFTNSEASRNLENLGLAGMTAEQIVEYARTGERK